MIHLIRPRHIADGYEFDMLTVPLYVVGAGCIILFVLLYFKIRQKNKQRQARLLRRRKRQEMAMKQTQQLLQQVSSAVLQPTVSRVKVVPMSAIPTIVAPVRGPLPAPTMVVAPAAAGVSSQPMEGPTVAPTKACTNVKNAVCMPVAVAQPML